MFRQLVAIFLLFSVFPAQATEAGWALLRNGGQVVLMRHAIAPGSGDPANFDIENCGTQRNLSERGRLQARRIGALVDARAAPVEKVLASRYCRTRDTATQAFGSDMVELFPALDLPADDSAMEKQKAEILARINDYTGSGNLFLITHLEIIEALIGASAREGEAIILSRGGDNLHAAARIKFN
ncbi:histidine phosphatase family protein [Nitratireductor sp. L1-7-SE]|uniref:Histidine phosphatase family protein n=1 Tax=Nitratireductor rhodophyticola TaxID=2854036 RepID=A0ABS7R2K6_9HYPH|nr:histidine phosphatase family protein [Nitratireductor rhodophyticola]MBY8915122.1 histidine phosphatase family protein [Nitratireductor rhodophyticola]MBY8919808.1 histidine phosphatase family protein [Nitratireductor rhodophyticola]